MTIPTRAASPIPFDELWKGINGNCLVPYMVISQAIEPVRLHLQETEMWIGRDLILKRRRKPYIKSELFVDYSQAVFLTHVAELRRNEKLSSEEAALLRDNCSPPLNPAVVELLTGARVCIITFVSHMTHIFQVLDLAVFDVLKQRGQDRLPFGNEKATAQFIKKVCHDFRRTLIDINISRHFERLALLFHR
jgi:hypothetical protein